MKLEINKLKNLTYVTVSKTSILILFIQLIGCIKPDNEIGNINKEAYYNFKDDDKQKLLPYLENQQINFKNQSGQERIFKITSVSKYYRNSYTVGMGFFTSYAAKYFDYDEKKVYLCDEMCGNFEITFSRWPINTELAKSNINIEYPSSFKGYITYFPYWNGLSDQNNDNSFIIIDYTLNKISLTINGTIYNDVVKLVSNNNNSIPSVNLNCLKNVNILYYDTKKGIIGFDDMLNNKWRIQN